MNLLARRKVGNDKASIAQFSVDGVFECYTLEDKDRGLTSTMPLSQIKEKKVHSQTAIPTGRYKVVLSYSQRFKRVLPEVKDVPGFSGIRIHSGNHSGNTEGCLLPGTWDGKAVDWVSGSRDAFNKLMAKIQKAWNKKEEIWLTVESAYSVAPHESVAFQEVLESATFFKEHETELMA